jgi:hypothetical protein
MGTGYLTFSKHCPTQQSKSFLQWAPVLPINVLWHKKTWCQQGPTQVKIVSGFWHSTRKWLAWEGRKKYNRSSLRMIFFSNLFGFYFWLFIVCGMYVGATFFCCCLYSICRCMGGGGDDPSKANQSFLWKQTPHPPANTKQGVVVSSALFLISFVPASVVTSPSNPLCFSSSPSFSIEAIWHRRGTDTLEGHRKGTETLVGHRRGTEALVGHRKGMKPLEGIEKGLDS